MWYICLTNTNDITVAGDGQVCNRALLFSIAVDITFQRRSSPMIGRLPGHKRRATYTWERETGHRLERADAGGRKGEETEEEAGEEEGREEGEREEGERERQRGVSEGRESIV